LTGYAGFVNHRPLATLALVLTTATACQAKQAMEEYMDKSKVAEANLNLRQLATTLQVYMEIEQVQPDGTFAIGKVPTTAAAPTPPLGTCCASEGKKCAPDPAVWAVEPWQTLKFQLDTPHYFSYEYVPAADGRSFTLKAHGDLDCDGEFMVVSLKGRWDEALGQPVIDAVEEPATLE
jgi:hypothetical protein